MKSVTVYFSDDLYQKLKEDASGKNYKLSRYINFITSEYLKEKHDENEICNLKNELSKWMNRLRKSKLYSKANLQICIENRILCSKIIQFLDTGDFEETLRKTKEESRKKVVDTMDILDAIEED